MTNTIIDAISAIDFIHSYTRPQSMCVSFSFLLQVMMGGHWFDELFGDPNTVSSDTLVEEALHSLYYQTKMDSVDPEHVIVNVLKVRE